MSGAHSHLDRGLYLIIVRFGALLEEFLDAQDENAFRIQKQTREAWATSGFGVFCLYWVWNWNSKSILVSVWVGRCLFVLHFYLQGEQIWLGQRLGQACSVCFTFEIETTNLAFSASGLDVVCLPYISNSQKANLAWAMSWLCAFYFYHICNSSSKFGLGSVWVVGVVCFY